MNRILLAQKTIPGINKWDHIKLNVFYIAKETTSRVKDNLQNEMGKTVPSTPQREDSYLEYETPKNRLPQ